MKRHLTAEEFEALVAGVPRAERMRFWAALMSLPEFSRYQKAVYQMLDDALLMRVARRCVPPLRCRNGQAKAGGKSGRRGKARREGG
jgi:hypothetical protein